MRAGLAFRVGLFSLAFGGLVSIAPAAERPPFDPATAVFVGESPPQAELALVLSGGGARGAAHVGVLRVLEELHIAPDLIVGTSMGAVVGGLYAAGYTPDEIEEIVKKTDWDGLFIDRIARTEKSFRRKQDDEIFLIPLKLRFRGWKPYMPPAAFGGQRLELLLRSLVMQAQDARDFNELPIPYRAVAADIETGLAVILGNGSLPDAMRASMSIAGTFPPVTLDGRRLVDGGAVANVPVGIAQYLGAKRVIAVDISSPLDESLEDSSLFGIMGQLSGLLTVGNRAVDVARLRDNDLLIQPDLHGVTFMGFKRILEAVGFGEEAARAQLEALRGFAATPERWAEFQQRHRRRDLARIPIEEVKVVNDSWVDDRIVARQLDIPTGVPLDVAKLDEQLLELNSLGYFGIIRDELSVVDGKGSLSIWTPAKPYSRASLQFGLSLESDLQGDSSYALATRHEVLAVNRRAGEWVNVLQIGSDIVASSEFYQPLDWGMRWFVAPSLTYERRNQPIWFEGEPIAEYTIKSTRGNLGAGRVLGNWGEARAEAFVGQASASPRIGSPILPSADIDAWGGALQFRVDTQNSAMFPTRGMRAEVRVERTIASDPADPDGTVSNVSIEQALTWGKNTVVFAAEAARSDEETGARGAVVLGGFLRLSGLGRDELVGEKGGLVRAIYFRDFVHLQFGPLSNRVFLGLSVEAGNAYDLADPISLASLRTGGAIFLGAETVAGPAYFGWGHTEPGRDHWYFVFGQRF